MGRVVTRLTQVEQDRIINEAVRRARGAVAVGASGGSGSGGGTSGSGPFVPMVIVTGTSFVVPANMQVCAAFPIVVEPGAILDILGALAFVN